MSESLGPGGDRRKLYLLLTATVDVGGVNSARNDPLERLADYDWALEQWLRCTTVDGLVFVENSGYDVAGLRSTAEQSGVDGRPVEFLVFDGQDFPRHLGKGYGENVNLDHVLRNSELLGEDDLLLRVNGRNYVENIDAFCAAMRPTTDILCDFKEYLTWGDGRVLGGSRKFFANYVVPYGRDVDDSRGYYFEHALARAIHRGIADGLAWKPFPEPPRISGVSGTSNTSHAENLLVRERRKLQHRVKLRMLR